MLATAGDVEWTADRLSAFQHARVEDEWTAHEHVFHLVHNDELFRARLADTLHAESPAFLNWDSEAFMRDHYSPARDITELAHDFAAGRRQLHAVFSRLAPAEWARTATWPDGKFVDLAWLAEKVTCHAIEHVAFLLDLHGELALRQANGTS